MLAELMTFNDKKMPNPNEIYKPQISKSNKEQAPTKIQRPKKQSIVNIEGLEELRKLEEETLKLIKEQEAMTLAEQILKRQQEEQENKRREILKQLQKPKNVNLKKFLTRTVGYEQKKNFDLEQKRFKQLEEETKICKDRPLLSHRTAEMCKTMYKKPIYKRTKEIIEKREKRINDIKNKDYSKLRSKKKKLNKSMDNINTDKVKKRKKKEYIINEKTKNKKMNSSEMREYYQRQYDWKNRLEEKNQLYLKNKKKDKTVECGEFFHPKISPGTIEIINEKNRLNERNHNQNIDSNNQYYYAKNDLNLNKLTLGKNVYDRLYEDNALNEIKKNDNISKAACSFQPFTNKNKYKQIQPKYKEIKLKNKKLKQRTRNAKNDLRGARSVEVERKKDTIETHNKKKMNSSFDVDKKSNQKQKKISEPWSNVLLRLKNNNNEVEDISYRLNVRQASAWNENDVNTVQLRGVSKEIVKFFL